jgi:hypothetical protein
MKFWASVVSRRLSFYAFDSAFYAVARQIRTKLRNVAIAFTGCAIRRKFLPDVYAEFGVLDEFSERLDDVAHQHGKNVVGFIYLLDLGTAATHYDQRW